ncbi:MAG: hypothetical protein DHS20C17_28300 [Cyclobacteriaceae bacterium]|nr:MAG: hypothetical protein DHS20C17_28300 [Cyclobacteriaceae bacterium]
METKAIYIPGINSSIKRLYNKVKRKFPYLEINIWDSRWLNEFMIHQPARFYILVEVEKDAMEPVFYFLHDTKSEVYLDPTSSILYQYARDAAAIIITNLVTEAPTQKIKDVTTATLEKILVDVYCNEKIFYAHQGHEMTVIFNEAFKKYRIEKSKLVRYAARRGKKTELQRFINEILRNGNY